MATSQHLNQAVVTEWDDANQDRFIMLYDDVWELIKGSNDLSVYLAMKRRVHADNGEWFSTRAALAREAGVSPKTFDRCIKSLESKGLVQSIPRYVPKGWSKDPALVSLVRDDDHPIQIGNLYRVRFRSPGNSDQTPSSKRPDPPGNSDQTPSSKRPDPPGNSDQTPSSNLGNRHRTQDIDTRDVEPPVVPQGGPVPKPKKGHRLPEGWMPDPDVIDAMRQENPGVDLQREHAKFSDHWAAASGANASKRDWNAAWRNWIRRAADSYPARQQSRPQTREEKLRAWGAPSQVHVPQDSPKELTW